MRNGLDLYKGKNSGLMNFSDFDEFFDRAFRNPWSLLEAMGANSMQREWFQPQVDMQENDEAFLLSVDLPGMRQEDVKIDLDGRVLTISGERKREDHSNNNGVTRVERSYGKFARSFSLPETIDIEKIEANLEDGVLRLALPKSEQVKPRTIEVKAGKPGFFSKLLGNDTKSEGQTQSTKQESKNH